MKRRLVYRDINNRPIIEHAPSYSRRQYTNQVYDENKKKWHFINRYIGKFGVNPIVWYWSKEHAEEFVPKDAEVCEMIKFTEDKDYDE